MSGVDWLRELLPQGSGRMSYELLGRFLFVVSCVGGCAAIWHLSPISVRQKKAAAAAGIVHFLLACSLELVVLNLGVYRYLITRQMLWGMPFDVHVGWAALWGAGLCMLWQPLHGASRAALVAGVIGVTLGLDFAALGTGRVFEPLTPWWWVWDLGALVVLALSTVGFYTLIVQRRALYLRGVVYAAAYTFLFYLLLPVLVLTLSGSTVGISAMWNVASLAGLAVCSIPGVIAAVQFAVQGDGSPLPLDPTRMLVTGGVYGHVRNPMQLSAVGATLVWALTARSWYLWIYLFDLVVLLQLIMMYEATELRERFGVEFERYRSGVRMWVPQWRGYRG